MYLLNASTIYYFPISFHLKYIDKINCQRTQRTQRIFKMYFTNFYIDSAQNTGIRTQSRQKNTAMAVPPFQLNENINENNERAK